MKLPPLPPALPHVHPLLLAVVHKHAFSYGFSWSTQACIALLAGIFILIRPKLLNFIVAAYLIVIGIMGLLHLSW